jgi:FKBP-type peptidyl-prolyl cis-trans isomerase
MLKHDILRTIIFGAIVVVLIIVFSLVWKGPKPGTRIFEAVGPAAVPVSTSTPGSDTWGATSQPSTASTTQSTGTKPMQSELKITDLTVGSGPEAKNGMKVTVNYVGTLVNGTKFDSSIDRGEPFTFTLGAGEVIQGWDYGVLGMKVGGKRKLVIPADLAYGSRAIGTIPANSTLVFEVDLLGVK